MAVVIEDARAESLVNALSELTGKDQTKLIVEILERELARRSELERKRRLIDDISRKACEKAQHVPLSNDDIIPYDENGVPV